MQLSFDVVVVIVVVYAGGQLSNFLQNYLNLQYLRTLVEACDRYANVKVKMAEVQAKSKPAAAAQQPAPPQQPAARDNVPH